MEATLKHWYELPMTSKLPKPSFLFFDPEVSTNGHVMSLPVRVENETLGSRAILQYSASKELYQYLPSTLAGEIEVGLTEPASDGIGWRHDWWNPHKDRSIGPMEAFRRLGFRMEDDPDNPGNARLIPGWRRRIQWLLWRLKNLWNQ